MKNVWVKSLLSCKMFGVQVAKRTRGVVWTLDLVVKICKSPIRVAGFDFWLQLLTVDSCWCRAWEIAVRVQLIQFMPSLWVTWIYFSSQLWSHLRGWCEPLGMNQWVDTFSYKLALPPPPLKLILWFWKEAKKNTGWGRNSVTLSKSVP